ncbi:FAD-dependent oxidoreductase [Candidatus Gottesmanbacteria bacterium]|nr:FAD-dependent oxidoreductase [Candidatus Gottesmanbacteria bacterium]
MKLTLKEIRSETKEAATFIFTLDIPIGYLSGQHVSIIVPIEAPDERGKVRTFTISSSPTQEGIITITTKRGPSSFKQTLFSLPIGSAIEARGPTGSMTLDESDNRLRVMIAGGIGITPFRSILKYAFDKKLNLPITLLYSNKTPEEIVFRAELDEIASKLPSVKIIHTITHLEESKEKWEGRTGRVDETMIKEVAPDLTNTLFFIAGPTAMVEAMIELLKGLTIPNENVKFEKFSGY